MPEPETDEQRRRREEQKRKDRQRERVLETLSQPSPSTDAAMIAAMTTIIS